jgi:serine/threonine protein kinase
MNMRLPKGFTHPAAIGRGAFASVFRARQLGTDRWVAVKLIAEKIPARRAALLHEAKVQAQINLECVPRVYDAFEWRSNVCIVMEWIYGVSLSILLETPLTKEERCGLAGRFIKSLADLHALNFAHRDLKPANILVTPDHGLRFVDFGFTKNAVDSARSISQTVKGTPAYLAPEVWALGSSVDLMRADVYSAGKLLAQILVDDPALSALNHCTAERPDKRPATGGAILSLWESLPTEQRVGYWPRSIAGLAAQHLATQLTHGAQTLLASGRTDEAYWLLADALKEDPEHHDAITLMTDFTRYVSQQKKTTGLRIAAAVVLVLILISSAFVLGKKNGRATSPSIASVTTDKRSTAMRRVHKERRSFVTDEQMLLKDAPNSDKLSGTLVIHKIPTHGTLTIDGRPADSPAQKNNTFSLSYGDHVIAWFDSSKTARWKEHVRILPFQTKAIVVNAPGSTDKTL